MSLPAGNVISRSVWMRLERLLPFMGMLAVLCAPATSAASGKVALVIANGAHESPAAAGCDTLGRAVATVLNADGFHVEQAINGSSVTIQSAILAFARQHGDERPTAVAYVCGEVTSEEKRLFLLPVNVNLNRPYRLQTQGVVLSAVMNALDGMDGVLLGDLRSTDVARARESLKVLLAAQNARIALSVRRDFSGDIGQKLITRLAQPSLGRMPLSKFLLGLEGDGGAGAIVVGARESGPEPEFLGPEMPSAVATAPVPNARRTEILQSSPAVEAKTDGVRKKRIRRPTAKRKISERPTLFSIFGADRRKKK